jgi:hypothetical protein
MLSESKMSEDGAAVWVGLLALLVFGSWEKSLDRASGGEMSFGSAIWAALCGLIFTAIAGGIIFDGHNPDEVMFIAAGVAGASSLILQATAWWLPAKATNAMRHFGPSPYDAGTEPRQSQPPSSADVTIALPRRPGQFDPPHYEQPAPGTGVYFRHDIGYGSPQAAAQAASAAYSATQAAAAYIVHGPERWMATRAFWGLVAFVLMGGAIVTFLIPLISENMPYHDVTAAIIACTGFAAFMIFALRKTTPVKRIGFWRETIRPFLLSAAMFGIGATITGIAREWEHAETCFESSQNCLGDEGRVALVAGLVMSSLLFLSLGLFTGRRPRPAKPFIQGGSETEMQSAPADRDSSHDPSGAGRDA